MSDLVSVAAEWREIFTRHVKCARYALLHRPVNVRHAAWFAVVVCVLRGGEEAPRRGSGLVSDALDESYPSGIRFGSVSRQVGELYSVAGCEGLHAEDCSRVVSFPLRGWLGRLKCCDVMAWLSNGLLAFPSPTVMRVWRSGKPGVGLPWEASCCSFFSSWTGCPWCLSRVRVAVR